MTTETIPKLIAPRTSKEVALKAVADAEMKLAEAMRAVADAVAAGEVKPCACYYMRFASAQSDLEGVQKELTGQRKSDRDGSSRSIIETLMAAATRG